MLKIFNSQTGEKKVFEPLVPGQVKIYICGPTVYDFCHIGNARTYAAFDIVIRYLRWRGFKVTYVRNITDIDDKIIKRAEESQTTFNAIVERFTQAMHDDFGALGFVKPDHEPRATEYIPQIIALIERLLKKDYAYVADNGDVYYEVRKFAAYGALSQRNIDQLESGARVEVNTVKRDPLDFVLWKLAKPGEPHWSSPWGEGRPGWHIECSAMSASLLGDHFDLHGGGKDLIFPHHENEIAQSQAATDQCFVNTWLHAGFLQIDKEKMSKSLGNFFTIRDIIKDHPPEVLYYLLISSHYRSPINFSQDALTHAKNSLTRFYTALRDLPNAQPVQNSHYRDEFIAAMDDDFNTPVALSVLFELAHEIQRSRENDLTKAAQHGALLKELAHVLGILTTDPQQFLQGDSKDIDVQKIAGLITARNQARAMKNWAEADRIRQELLAMNVVLEDGANGTTWKRE